MCVCVCVCAAAIEGQVHPGLVAGLKLDCLATVPAFNLVFDVIHRCAEGVGALLGFGRESQEVARLREITKDNVVVRLHPLEVTKYGPSMVAPLFVSLVSLATGRKVEKGVAVTGEIGLW